MTKLKAIVIPADDTEPLRATEVDGGDITAIHEIVGGYFECVDLPPGATFFVNETGKIDGSERNAKATLLLWLQAPEWREQDIIFGDVLLLGQPDSEGSTTSVPDDLFTLLMETTTYKVEVQTIGSESWATNSVTYEDPFLAAFQGLSLAKRWKLVSAVRIVAA